LLDQNLVELAARIPQRFNLAGSHGKKLLKRLAYRYLPGALVDRPKMGFSVPLNAWFRGELAQALQDMCANPGSRLWDYYDRATVARFVRAHQEGTADWSYVLWRVFVFHQWCEVKLRAPRYE